MLILSLEFAVRLVSSGPNSQLHCSAECLQDGPRTENTVPILLHAILLEFSRDLNLGTPLVR
jgi:hypothetical protein